VKKINITYFNYGNQSRLYNDGYKIVYLIEDIDYDIDEKYEILEEFKWRRLNEQMKIKVLYLIK